MLERRAFLSHLTLVWAPLVWTPPAWTPRRPPASLTSCPNVRDYGATGDGTSNDRHSLQRALDAAGEKGGVVWVPAGTYQHGDTHLTYPSGIVVADEGEASVLRNGVDKDHRQMLMTDPDAGVRDVVFRTC